MYNVACFRFRCGKVALMEAYSHERYSAANTSNPSIVKNVIPVYFIVLPIAIANSACLGLTICVAPCAYRNKLYGKGVEAANKSPQKPQTANFSLHFINFCLLFSLLMIKLLIKYPNFINSIAIPISTASKIGNVIYHGYELNVAI